MLTAVLKTGNILYVPESWSQGFINADDCTLSVTYHAKAPVTWRGKVKEEVREILQGWQKKKLKPKDLLTSTDAKVIAQKQKLISLHKMAVGVSNRDADALFNMASLLGAYEGLEGVRKGYDISEQALRVDPCHNQALLQRISFAQIVLDDALFKSKSYEKDDYTKIAPLKELPHLTIKQITDWYKKAKSLYKENTRIAESEKKWNDFIGVGGDWEKDDAAGPGKEAEEDNEEINFEDSQEFVDLKKEYEENIKAQFHKLYPKDFENAELEARDFLRENMDKFIAELKIAQSPEGGYPAPNKAEMPEGEPGAPGTENIAGDMGGEEL